MIMAVETKFKMSRQRFDELKTELTYLQTVREKEISELIKEARSFGDLSENSEYDEAKTEQGKLYSKIAELKNLTENAEIIEKAAATDSVSIGSTVIVRDLDSGEDEEFQLVGSQEANPMLGKISDDSPFGKSLLNKVIGDQVSFDAPAGTLRFEILNILH